MELENLALKSLKARTTGKLKRSLKKSVNPFYGKKGTGLVTNPKKSIYNKVYKKQVLVYSTCLNDSEVYIYEEKER